MNLKSIAIFLLENLSFENDITEKENDLQRNISITAIGGAR